MSSYPSASRVKPTEDQTHRTHSAKYLVIGERMSPSEPRPAQLTHHLQPPVSPGPSKGPAFGAEIDIPIWLDVMILWDSMLL